MLGSVNGAGGQQQFLCKGRVKPDYTDLEASRICGNEDNEYKYVLKKYICEGEKRR